MRFSFTKLALLLLLCLCLACAVPELLAKKKEKESPAANEQHRAIHALNRLAFGPRPGDVQRVTEMGVDKWIDEQLHPEKISDSALDTRLAPFRTLRMSSHQMVEEFPDGQMIRQVMDGKKSIPSDPARRAIFQAQIGRQQEKKEEKQQKIEQRKEAKAEFAPPQPAASTSTMAEPPSAVDTAKTAEEIAAAAAASPDTPANQPPSENAMSAAPPAPASASENTMPAPPEPMPVDDVQARKMEDRLYADLEVQKLIDLPPDQRYKKVLAMSAEQQLAFADAERGPKGQDFLNGLDPKQREVLQAMNNPQSVISDELIQAKLLRAIYSERQLEQVMTDFWFNHFNVFVGKGADRILITSYEQDVIRPHALGKFEDLLVATAKSPAMLFYLDNWLSVGPNSMQALGIPPGPPRFGPYRYPPRFPGPAPKSKKQNSGLNENYGRELLELHTLSVNGGYSQRDVTEVAKVFTGWTIDKPNEGGSFRFDLRRHEPGPKFVLGHHIKFKGEDEGREVLHLLATNPQTAHFISLKLAQRFVSDDPPPALVDRMAKTFLKKKGDIREVLATLFHSPEFWDETTYRAKVKTPLEFVASAVRATGAEVDDAMPLARQLNNMGMPLYGAQPPTGYSMKAETWVSSSALLNRMNFALALTSGKVRGVRVDTVQLAGENSAPPDPALALSAMEGKLLADNVSQQTHDSIVAQLSQPSKSAAMLPDDKREQNKSKPADQPHPPDVNTIAGLLLGSPEFQRR
ncbi:MAG TPA: DUF1800 domain-containing protein [Candidatus Sulfotelmatobacter sp.]|nr:DUF1800 domain-containing protein [Candidatus Sulfotelmatobacter sp.]